MTQVTTRPRKSTIVRTPLVPAPVRASFWLLERIAPVLGARWAEQLWFTLPSSRPTRDAAATPPGQRFTLRGLVGDVWGDGTPVYLMHGWAGHRRQLDAFVAPLVARGHRVVSFDAPSHGESAPGSSGPRSGSAVEFTDALAAVVAEHGQAHAIVAHSMGAVAAAGALCDGLLASRLALLAPMAGPTAYTHQFGRMLGFGERTRQRLIARVERRIGAPMHHFDVPELGRAVAMPPTLIVHDRDDTSVPVSDAAAIAAAWPLARLHVTSGLGHNRLLRDPGVVAQVVDFIAD